jgi:DNA-directed RNA polymerase subunit K/omega
MADENEEYTEDIDAEVGEDIEVDAVGTGERVEVKSTDPLQLLFRHHPECRIYYAAAVTPKLALLAAPPDFPTRTGAPDPNHRSQAWLSQFERTKIIGFRSNQLAQGAKAYVDLSKHKHIVNTGEIARLELNEGRLPFIVARLMPDGQFEFWSLADLLLL